MIQRIQSIFLLLAAAFFGGQFFTSFASSSGTAQGFFADSMYSIQDHPVLIVLCVLGIAAALVAIFLYNNRSTQLKVSYLAITMAVLLPLIAILLYTNQTEQMGDIQVEDQAGLYLPIGSIIMGILAARFIQKDSKLVKSMDRLR